MGLFDEFKRLAHPYEDEEPDDDFDGFDDFDAPAPRAERRERPERLERSSRNVDTLVFKEIVKYLRPGDCLVPSRPDAAPRYPTRTGSAP